MRRCTCCSGAARRWPARLPPAVRRSAFPSPRAAGRWRWATAASSARSRARWRAPSARRSWWQGAPGDIGDADREHVTEADVVAGRRHRVVGDRQRHGRRRSVEDCRRRLLGEGDVRRSGAGGGAGRGQQGKRAAQHQDCSDTDPRRLARFEAGNPAALFILRSCRFGPSECTIYPVVTPAPTRADKRGLQESMMADSKSRRLGEWDAHALPCILQSMKSRFAARCRRREQWPGRELGGDLSAGHRIVDRHRLDTGGPGRCLGGRPVERCGAGGRWCQ